MKKKIVSIIMASMMAAASLAGCGGENASTAETTTVSENTSTTKTNTTETNAAKTTEKTADASKSSSASGDWKDNIGYTLTPFKDVSYEDIYFARVAVSEEDMGADWDKPWQAFDDMLMQDDNVIAYKEVSQNYDPDAEMSENDIQALFNTAYANFGKTPADVFGSLSMYECNCEYRLQAYGTEMNDDENELSMDTLFSCTEIPDSELSGTFIARNVSIDYDGNSYEGDQAHSYCYYDKKNGIQYIDTDISWEAYQADNSLGSNVHVGSLIKSTDALTPVYFKKDSDGYRAKYTTPISNIQSESNVYEGFIRSMPDDMEASVHVHLYKDGTLKSIEVNISADKDSIESEPFKVRDDDTFEVTSIWIKAEYSIPAYDILDEYGLDQITSVSCLYRTDTPSKDDEVRFDYTEADENSWLYGGNDSIQTPQDYVDYFDKNYMTNSGE